MIFRGSRYVNSKFYYDSQNDLVYMGVPEEKFPAKISDMTIVFKEGMRLDLLAYKYYKDPQLDWVIMQANPKYASPEDIEPGDLIVIPTPRRVLNNV